MRTLTPPAATHELLRQPAQYLSKQGARVWAYTDQALVVLAADEQAPVLVSAPRDELVCTCQRNRYDPALCSHQSAVLELYEWPAPLLPTAHSRRRRLRRNARLRTSTPLISTRLVEKPPQASPSPAPSKPATRPPWTPPRKPSRLWYVDRPQMAPAWYECPDCGILWQPALLPGQKRPHAPIHDCCGLGVLA